MFLGAIVGVIILGLFGALFTFIAPLPDCSLIDPSVSDSELQQNEKIAELEYCNDRTGLVWAFVFVMPMVGFLLIYNMLRSYNKPTESP